MAFLPDHITPQPDEEMIAAIRHLSSQALAAYGHVLPAENIEALTGLLITGTLGINSDTASMFHDNMLSSGSTFPSWVRKLFYALHQLSPVPSETQGGVHAQRQQWNDLARAALEHAVSDLNQYGIPT